MSRNELSPASCAVIDRLVGEGYYVILESPYRGKMKGYESVGGNPGWMCVIGFVGAGTKRVEDPDVNVAVQKAAGFAPEVRPKEAP